MNIIIRPAKPQEANILTVLARRSNHFWEYPEEYHVKWDRELQMLPSHIIQNMVYVAEQSDEIIGYFSIVHIKWDCQIGNRLVNKGYWLENLFVLPEYIGKGVGSALIGHAKFLCSEKGWRELHVFVEPYSRGFYDRMGGRLIRQSPTEINGRVIPVYLLPTI
ncbi:MAG: GNAT family N-acetyltransferase [Bacillota bacterium]|nr:GNAT family N-acetyltransferase [Bacillota bacterium]